MQSTAAVPQQQAPPAPAAAVDTTTDHPSDPASYIRDPHKLIAYVLPFPVPKTALAHPSIHSTSSNQSAVNDFPLRIFLYTPPPPPLAKPVEGEKEDRVHKVQRKWQEEVKEAKLVGSKQKATSWKGIKGRVTKGIDWGIGKVTTADLDFVNRVPDAKPSSSSSTHDSHADDGVHEDGTTNRTVGLTEMVLVYPPSLNLTDDQLRHEFVESLLRTKTKAQRDAVIATGLLPVAFGVDLMATLIWPFGGLAEADGVWSFSSIKGAKTARSVTKRLASSTKSGDLNGNDDAGDELKLTFRKSESVEPLREYLASQCAQKDQDLFTPPTHVPTETEVLEAIGWQPSTRTSTATTTASPAAPEMETTNWEDEAWEVDQVKEDLKLTMGKAAAGWKKWVKAYEKNPDKALKRN